MEIMPQLAYPAGNQSLAGNPVVLIVIRRGVTVPGRKSGKILCHGFQSYSKNTRIMRWIFMKYVRSRLEFSSREPDCFNYPLAARAGGYELLDGTTGFTFRRQEVNGSGGN
jgi:hypothetical protein